MNFFFFYEFSDIFELFFILFSFFFLSLWFYYFFSFYEVLLLIIIKLHFKLIEEFSLFFESPTLEFLIPRAYNLFFTWFPDRHIFFDFYWAQNLNDEETRQLLRQMRPFDDFLEAVREKSALDFSNLDKAFSERIRKAQEQLPVHEKNFDFETRFGYWTSLIESKEDVDSEIQMFGENMYNYINASQIFAKNKFEFDNYDKRRRYIPIEFLNKNLNVEDIEKDYINKFNTKTIKWGDFEVEIKKRNDKNWDKIQTDIDYYNHMYFLKDYWFKLKTFTDQSGWDLNGIKHNNLMRNSKFYKFQNENFSYFLNSGSDPEDWNDDFSVLARFFFAFYFFFASSCILYMFFFIIDFEFMTFIYLLQTLFYLFIV